MLRKMYKIPHKIYCRKKWKARKNRRNERERKKRRKKIQEERKNLRKRQKRNSRRPRPFKNSYYFDWIWLLLHLCVRAFIINRWGTLTHSVLDFLAMCKLRGKKVCSICSFVERRNANGWSKTIIILFKLECMKLQLIIIMMMATEHVYSSR